MVDRLAAGADRGVLAADGLGLAHRNCTSRATLPGDGGPVGPGTGQSSVGARARQAAGAGWNRGATRTVGGGG
ncbi:hypothetical protein GCM10009616_21670 [Microlunatus lacustris]